MKPVHVIAVAFVLGAAAVLGVLAAVRTTEIGAAANGSAHVSTTAIAARSKKLNAAERALRRALNDRPPALPPIPTTRRPAQAPQVVYRRPAPLIVLRHGQSHGDHEAEHEAESADD
jgi:hypothetical protein